MATARFANEAGLPHEVDRVEQYDWLIRKGRRDAMARLPRLQQRATSAYYYVRNRGHNREAVFQADQDYVYLGMDKQVT
jgi:hypothetical protein